MKALSPFLPDVPTLTSLFAGAGIVAAPESAESQRSRPRAVAASRPPPPRAETTPGVAPPPIPTGTPAIRFPVSTVVATIPSKGPLRASIPPFEPANGSGVHTAVTASGLHPTVSPSPRAHTGAPVAIPPSASGLHVVQVPNPVAAKPANDQLTDEAALQLIFGRRDRGAPPLQQRFEAFVDWLGTGVGAQGSFVADDDGLVLANRNAPDTYAVATVSLCHAEQSVLDYMPRPTEGTTTLELDDTNFLQVIRVDTVVGRLIVGVIVAAPLNRTICALVRRLMRIGVEWEAVR